MRRSTSSNQCWLCLGEQPEPGLLEQHVYGPPRKLSIGFVMNACICYACTDLEGYQSKDSDYVCGSCGTPLSTPHNMLITECHNSHKHSQSPLTKDEHNKAITVLQQHPLWLGPKNRKLRDYVCNTWLDLSIIKVPCYWYSPGIVRIKYQAICEDVFNSKHPFNNMS